MDSGDVMGKRWMDRCDMMRWVDRGDVRRGEVGG